MYSGSVAATGTQSCGFAASISSFQSKSRPLAISARACGRCKIMHADGLCLARAMAASSSGLYSTTRPGSRPHEAETMSFGLQSSIRTANSSAAKPPNTTECTAPSRAHASIATTACGVMGM